jgi:hypothetical protein
MKFIKYVSLIVLISTLLSATVEPKLKLALLKYSGGGDWYANPTALSNLSDFCNDQLKTNFDRKYATVEVGSTEIFNYPFLHMTGHGNVVFSDQDAENLRGYLIAGGFLHIDDNYGMDPFVRPAMKKVFPELDMIEIPFDHKIFHSQYSFPNGLPKIHEHDNLPPRGYGILWEGRLVCFYSQECDLGDGWEDQEVHNDSPENRLKALMMGANLIKYAFSN